jgi:hypothetical protein
MGVPTVALKGKLMWHAFRAFRTAELLQHHTTSPPHDHDLNPIEI